MDAFWCVAKRKLRTSPCEKKAEDVSMTKIWGVFILSVCCKGNDIDKACIVHQLDVWYKDVLILVNVTFEYYSTVESWWWQDFAIWLCHDSITKPFHFMSDDFPLVNIWVQSRKHLHPSCVFGFTVILPYQELRCACVGIVLSHLRRAVALRQCTRTTFFSSLFFSNLFCVWFLFCSPFFFFFFFLFKFSLW